MCLRSRILNEKLHVTCLWFNIPSRMYPRDVKSAWTTGPSENRNDGREKKSIWQFFTLQNCQHIIFGIAAVVLASLFSFQVRDITIDQLIYVIRVFENFQMIQCLVKYRDSPTYNSSQIVGQGEADFPAITVCPHNGGLKLDVLQVYGDTF